MSMKIDKTMILNKIKSHYGYSSDASFARFLEIKPQTLSSWHSRNTFDVDLLYAKCGDIAADFIISGKEPMLRREEVPSMVEESPHSYNMPSVITVDSLDNENIPFVPVKARAGYLEGYHKPEFMKTLPTFRVPSLNNGTFRMFEVGGHSMNLTLPNKSIAVGEWVENWDKNIKDGRIYIIVYDDGDRMEDGILIKRCLNRIKKYNNLICKSDTLDRFSYPNISIDPAFIKEVWELKGAFKFEFPDPSNFFKRMDDLEAESEQIKRILKQITENQGFN